MEQESISDTIKNLDSKLDRLSGKMKDREKEIDELNDAKSELEARIRVLESEDFEKIKKDLYSTISKIEVFESHHDENKEKWNMALNFIVQLVWVSMAAFMLTKLGLQAPL
jgi:hypothetical protein